jgi:hypothetical protein
MYFSLEIDSNTNVMKEQKDLPAALRELADHLENGGELPKGPNVGLILDVSGTTVGNWLLKT